MKVDIVNQTSSYLVLNTLNIKIPPLTVANVDVPSEGTKIIDRDVLELERNGLVTIRRDSDVIKTKAVRPTGKNKKPVKRSDVHELVDSTPASERMGSMTTVVTESGIQKRKMVHSVVGDRKTPDKTVTAKKSSTEDSNDKGVEDNDDYSSAFIDMNK